MFFDVGYATPHILRTELLHLWDEWTNTKAKGEVVAVGEDQDREDEVHEVDVEEGIVGEVEVGEEDQGWSYEEVTRLLFSILRWDVTECKVIKGGGLIKR